MKTGLEEPQEPGKYSTPVQRVWAWVGVVYVVLVSLLTTYGVANGGNFLRGIGGLLLAPAFLGGAATSLLRVRQEPNQALKVAWCVLAALGGLLAAGGLIQAIPNLLNQLRGVTA